MNKMKHNQITQLTIRSKLLALVNLIFLVTALCAPPKHVLGADATENIDKIGDGIKGLPPRDPETKINLIDLSDFYNGSVKDGWFPNTALGTTADKRLNLSLGVGRFDGVDFDVRGAIQLSGQRLKSMGGEFPEKVQGIKIGLKCKRLFVLQAADSAATFYVPEGTDIGGYIVRYVDGSSQRIPIVTGIDLRDWVRHDADEVSRGAVVWNGKAPNGWPVRLYKGEWANPTPEIEIKSIDYISKMTKASPFLIAITAE